MGYTIHAPQTIDELVEFIDTGGIQRMFVGAKCLEIEHRYSLAKLQEIIDFPKPIVDIGGVDGTVLRNIAREAIERLQAF